MAEAAMTREDAQEAFAQLQYLQSVYSQRYDILTEQLTAYNVARDAVQRGIDFIGRASGMENSNILVNTDGGTYVEATIKKVEKVVTYVGAGFLVEKPLDEAKAFLEGTIKQGDSSINKIVSERQRVEKELYDISYRITALRQA